MGVDSPAAGDSTLGGMTTNPYEDEARERWGQTEAYRQSQERTSKYSKDDWARIQGEAAENTAAFTAAFSGGVPATDAGVLDLAEAHRQHISRWYYDCTTEIHRGLGDMYVADPRFTAHYDTERPGLAEYIRDAIHANAERQN